MSITPQDLVPDAKLFQALAHLPSYRWIGTEMSWANWRNSWQIIVSWNDGQALRCYVCFNTRAERDSTLQAAAHKWAQLATKVDLGGMQHPDDPPVCRIRLPAVSNIHELVDLAHQQGSSVSVIYKQECISARAAFDMMGIPLVPGECGKELTAQGYISYHAPAGQCL